MITGKIVHYDFDGPVVAAVTDLGEVMPAVANFGVGFAADVAEQLVDAMPGCAVGTAFTIKHKEIPQAIGVYATPEAFEKFWAEWDRAWEIKRGRPKHAQL
jgi:hypothetical protein